MARHVTGSTGQYLNVLTGAALPYPLTLSIRIKYTAALAAPGVIQVYGEADPSWDGEYLYGTASGIQAASGKVSVFPATPPLIPPVVGQWYLYVAVYDGSGTTGVSRRLYVDNSTQTTSEATAVSHTGHVNKNYTIGGVLHIGALVAGATFDGDVADAAIWNVALTAADVDALAAGRPGDVKPANLQAWYKLGEDGDLTSSVGSYPAMTVVGTVAVTTDPPYATGTPGNIKTINSIAASSVKTFLNIPKASIKTINSLTMGGGAAFSPADIAGLQAWYKADSGIWSKSSASFIANNAELLQMANNSFIRLGNFPWTMGGWFFQYGQAQAADLIMSKRGATVVDYQFHLTGGSNITFLVWNGTGYPGPSASYTTGQWVYVVGSYDGAGNLTIQVNNGTPVTAATGIPVDSTNPLGFGGDISSPLTYDFHGGLQNWFIFARALDTTERSFLWNGGAGRHYGELSPAFKTNLRAWWPFDEKDGSRVDVHNGLVLTDVNTVGSSGAIILNPARNNTPVYRWDDQSVSGAHALNEDITRHPILTDIPGQLPRVQFDGTNDVLVAVNAPTSAVFTAYHTAKKTTPSVGTGRVVLAYMTGGVEQAQIHTDVIAGEVGSGGRNTVNAIGFSNATGNEALFHVEKLLRTLTGIQLFYNNVASAGETAIAGTGRSGLFNLGMGAYPDSTVHWDGQIGEVIIYDSVLSPANRALVEAYLTSRWGV